MYNKRSPLFFTELLLLFLVSQLFWPIQQFVGETPFSIYAIKTLLFVVSWIVLLVLPGWRWSYLFFDDDQIGSFERFIMSLAISLALVVFSSAYLQLGGVALYPRTILTIISGWIFTGIIVAFSVRKSTDTQAEEGEEMYS